MATLLPVLFELDDVTLDLNGNRILDEVSVRVPAKGVTVVQGASGSGKSTLLRLLNRLEVPTHGEVRFRGEPLNRMDPLGLRRRVGMVFQRPTPFPGTVRENLLVADPQAGQVALEQVLQSVGLVPPRTFLDRLADELSGGEAQRLCLARTLLTHPEVLLMDEPTSALDEDATTHLERTAHRLVEGGMPMVWVTHDRAQADRMGDHFIAMRAGRIVPVASGGNSSPSTETGSPGSDPLWGLEA